jgi:hypothetical protein
MIAIISRRSATTKPISASAAGTSASICKTTASRCRTRERSFEQATGHSMPGRRDRFVQARAVLRRIEAKLARDDATLHREEVRVDRDQAVIDRESAATAQSEPRPENRPSDEREDSR